MSTINVISNETPETLQSARSDGEMGKVADTSEAAPAKAKAESKDEPEPSEQEREGTHAKDGEGEKEEDAEGKAGKPGRPKGGFQRKIDKTTRAWRTAEAERDQARAEQERLRAELEQLRAGRVEPKKEDVPSAQVPDASKEPQAEDFENHADFVKALVKWSGEEARRQDAKERKTREDAAAKAKAESNVKAAFDEYQDSLKEAHERHADFKEILKDVAEVVIPGHLRKLIVESDDGGELTYALAKNPDELKRICALAPDRAARALGAFEAKHLSEPEETEEEEAEPEEESEEEAPKQSKKITKAPAPIKPVGGSGRSQTEKSIYDESLSQSDFEELERKRLARKRA